MMISTGSVNLYLALLFYVNVFGNGYAGNISMDIH